MYSNPLENLHAGTLRAHVLPDETLLQHFINVEKEEIKEVDTLVSRLRCDQPAGSRVSAKHARPHTHAHMQARYRRSTACAENDVPYTVLIFFTSKSSVTLFGPKDFCITVRSVSDCVLWSLT